MYYTLSDISYCYSAGGKKVLNQVSFGIEKGKITALVGPSGSGKSTLVQILSGVIPKLITGGELEGALDIPKETLISVVSQNPENQLFGYGVDDALAFGLENMGTPRPLIKERMNYVSDLLHIQHLRGRSIDNLSGGQRQAVCIASVLAMNPDILIMDEPVSSLDPNGKKLVRDILKALSDSKTTTLIVDSNLAWSADIVEHVVGLSEGCVLFDGGKDSFFSDFRMQEMLGVILPQQVELYRELSEASPELCSCASPEEAEVRILSLLEQEGHEKEKKQAVIKSDPSVIESRGLVKKFRNGVTALDHIDAVLPEGETVAVLGQNGSGKTTFFKSLNGLYKASSGEILFRGDSILTRSVAQISRDIIMVFQHPDHMLFEETVEREMTFCARMQGISIPAGKVEELLMRYGMGDDKDQFPLNLPMGKRHLLTILSVLFSRARVVLLDEPTLGMDRFLIQKLEQIISELKGEGRTVVLISHEIPLVFKVCDYVIVLNEGHKVFEGTKASLARQDELFEKIQISLPPVVQLSRKAMTDQVAFSAEELVRAAIA